MFQNVEGVAGGETPPKNKTNVDKLKSDQNIWNVYIVKCSIYSPIKYFFLNIAKNLHDLGHILVI